MGNILTSAKDVFTVLIVSPVSKVRRTGCCARTYSKTEILRTVDDQ